MFFNGNIFLQVFKILEQVKGFPTEKIKSSKFFWSSQKFLIDSENMRSFKGFVSKLFFLILLQKCLRDRSKSQGPLRTLCKISNISKYQNIS